MFELNDLFNKDGILSFFCASHGGCCDEWTVWESIDIFQCLKYFFVNTSIYTSEKYTLIFDMYYDILLRQDEAD